MEIEERKNIRDDRMSDCRSFGSNCHPCSQSRKISIGIMVDSTLKAKSGVTKGKEVPVANAEKVTSTKGNSIQGKRESQGVSASMRGKNAEAPELESSPWISTKSTSPTVNTVPHAKQNSSLPANSGRQNKLNEEKDLAKVHSAQFVANDTLILQAGDGNQKKFVRVTYKRRGGSDETADRAEEFSYATAHDVRVSDKGAIEDKTKKSEIRSSEALKMKLWEILGTVSSPIKQFSKSQRLDPDAKSSKLEKVCDAKGDTVVKSRQNSDTIETDSENLDRTIRRPVTRSLTRKRAPSRVQLKKLRTGTSARHKQNNEEKNIFYFQEGMSGSLPAVNGGSSISRMKNERESSKIEPRKISFLDSKKIPQPPEETSSLGSKMKGLPAFPLHVDRECVKRKSEILKKDFDESLVARNTVKVRDIDSPSLSENADQHEDYGNPSLNDNVDEQDDLRSLTIGTKLPTKRTSPSPPPYTDQMEMDCCSPASAKNIFTVGNICSFKTWQTSKPVFHSSNVQTESSDDEEELKDSPTRNSEPSMEEKDRGLSKSPSQERDSTSSEDQDDSPINVGYHGWMEDGALSPKIGTAERPKNIIHSTKRLRGHGGIKFNEFSPISPSPQGTDEGDGFCEPSEQNQDDGLSRAVTLFALALERLQSKVKSMTKRKSSEILKSAADGINLQMHNVESQIQEDVGKLTSLSKSKRRCLETRFQEHQDKLKLINEKFKEEVNQHLQDCSSTLEGLEANKIDFKGTFERQKASHRKLLLQLEKAIESQLNDAERRIAGVHKLANERMLELKQVIAECLMEGVLD